MRAYVRRRWHVSRFFLSFYFVSRFRANEADNKSVSGTGSRRSNDSSDTQSGVDGNFQTQLNDECEDLWTIWGNLVKNWDVEFKKRPQYIKVKVIVNKFAENFISRCRRLFPER